VPGLRFNVEVRAWQAHLNIY
jgi:hypothetical protein